MKIPVLITTDKRGVFFGYIDPKDSTADEILVDDVQMCVYWSADVRGVFGLAVNGPSKTSRVSAPIKSGRLSGITFVGSCSETAVAAWKSQPWG